MIKLISNFLSAAGLIFLVAACNSGGYSTNEHGLQYRIIRSESNRKLQLNDIVRMNLTYSTMKDSLLYDSRVIGDSFILKVNPPSFIGGFEEGLLLLGEGDSAEFLLPADSVFRNLFQQPRPAYIAAGSMLKFRVGVKDVLDKNELAEMQRKDYARQQMLQVKAIERYFTENSISAPPSSPGVYFIMLKEGSGRIPQNGDSVEVKYTGKTLAGSIFDSSSKAGRNLFYRVGTGNYLKAWEQAITSMKEGSYARLILTSDNAFKKSTAAPVPPDTPVIFDIELIRIIK